MLMETLHNLPAVIIAGLLFGAGLPVLFAFAMRANAGTTEAQEYGSLVKTGPAPLPLRIVSGILFAIVIILVIIGVLWVSQHFLYTSFGWDIFGTGGQG